MIRAYIQKNPIIVLLTLTALSFISSLSHDFINWDDNLNIYAHAEVIRPSYESFKEIWARPLWGLYIPFTYSIWMLMALVSSTPSKYEGMVHPEAFGYHLLNFTVHLINVYLIFKILCLLFLEGRKIHERNIKNKEKKKDVKGPWFDQLPFLFGTAFFAFHPLQVESVVWATTLKDLLSTMFFLSTLKILLEFYIDDHRNLNKKKILKNTVLAFVFFICGLLTKPNIVVLTAVLPLCYIFIDEKKWIKDKFSIGILIGLLFVTMAVVIKTISNQWAPDMDIWKRPFYMIDTYGFYIRKLILPVLLSIDYGRKALYLEEGGLLWISTGLHLLAITFLIYLYKRKLSKEHELRRVIIFSLSLFFIILLPVSCLITFNYQLISNVADRYMYLTMIAPSIFITGLLKEKWSPRIFIPLSLFLCLIFFATISRVMAWKESKVIYSVSLKNAPQATYMRGKLANSYFIDKEYNKALELIDKQIALVPDDPMAYHLKASIYNNLKLYSKAKEQLDIALTYNMVHSPSLSLMGEVLIAMEKYDEAQEYLERGTTTELDLGSSDFQLGNLAIARKDYKKAKYHFNKAIEQTPNFSEAHNNLGNIYAMTGDYDQALKHFEIALEQNKMLYGAQFNIAKLHLVKGSTEKGIELLRDLQKKETEYQEEIDEINEFLFKTSKAINEW